MNLIIYCRSEKAYWMVEDVFHKIHEEQIEETRGKSKTKGTKTPQFEPREVDGKMDKKQFLEYVKG